MFVYFFTHLMRPFDEVEPLFVEHAERWIPHHLEEAFESREALRVRVGLGKGFRVGKDVLVSVGESRREETKTFLPIDVQATHPASLFPHLQADLELARLGPGMTQLTLRGSYRPPLGLVGEAIDRALLHRVAEAAVKDFVEQLGARLEAALGRVSSGYPATKACIENVPV